jgi:hypothetical protein
MRWARLMFIVVGVVVSVWGVAGVGVERVQAVVCCGMYTCVKIDDNNNITDSYGVNCNSNTVGRSCGGAGCQTGYERVADSCEWDGGQHAKPSVRAE